MPKKLPADEEKLLRFFIKEGAVEEKIPVVAKRFRLTVGGVKRKLALKRVQEELRVRMEPIRLEQQRQQMLADDVAQATAKLIADKEKAESDLKAATQMPSMELTVEVLERELMRIACLDAEKHGRIKLAAIQTGYVIKGVMEQGTTRRVNPPDRGAETTAGGVYTNLFDRLRLEREAKSAAEEIVVDAETEDVVYDLTPQPVEASRTKEIVAEMPIEGESIDVMPAAKRDVGARVITVEVG